MPGTPEGATATDDELAAAACSRARSLAEQGDLAGAATEFQRVLARGETRSRGEAAFGLGAVREAQGDVEGARDACRLALRSGDPDYAPRGAYNLAVSYEHTGERGEARAAWQAVLDSGNERYLPGALCALADLASDAGDADHAEKLWRRAAAMDDQEYAPLAAHNLGAALLQRGELAAAQETFATAAAHDPDGHARINLGVTHLEQAVSAFQGALACADEETYPLAAELLARTLPLRGAYEAAERTWEQALSHDNPDVAAAVHARLRRDFDGAGSAWWDEYVETAVRAGTLPQLAGELFAVITAMHEAAGEPETLRQIAAAQPWGGHLSAGS